MLGNDWQHDGEKAYLVIGGHRGGTSFLANALAGVGVDMGAVSWRREHNPAVLLNRDIIRAAGGVWHEPPGHEAILSQSLAHAGAMREIILGRRASGMLWGIKDPRLTLTLGAWLPFVPASIDPYLIAIFRRPERVAASLAGRGAFGYTKALALSREYTRRTLLGIRLFTGLEGEG